MIDGSKLNNTLKMMNTVRSYTYCLVMIVSAISAACSQEPDIDLREDSELAFYNASQMLRKELLEKNPYYPSTPALILLDRDDVRYTSEGVDDVKTPYFAVARAGQHYFPQNDFSGTIAIPWQGYLRVWPGEHAVSFLKTDSSLAVHTLVETVKRGRTCVFLTDSLGAYHTFVTNDNTRPAQSEVDIRLLHLSPDLQPFFIKINDEWIEMPGPIHYRGASGFITCQVTDSMGQDMVYKIQLRAAADTSVVLVRTSINVTPGHSYSIIANGYMNDYMYTDNTSGDEVTITSDFRMSVIRNR